MQGLTVYQYSFVISRSTDRASIEYVLNVSIVSCRQGRLKICGEPKLMSLTGPQHAQNTCMYLTTKTKNIYICKAKQYLIFFAKKGSF